MLIEQNTQLRHDLDLAQAELRQLRAHELATAATGTLAGRISTDGNGTELRRHPRFL